MTNPRRALWLPPAEAFRSPALLMRLAEAAEPAGWDGLFLFEHSRAPGRPPAMDPWRALALLATCTSTLHLGAQLTPELRAHPPALARRVALQLLAPGRVVHGMHRTLLDAFLDGGHPGATPLDLPVPNPPVPLWLSVPVTAGPAPRVHDSVADGYFPLPADSTTGSHVPIQDLERCRAAIRAHRGPDWCGDLVTAWGPLTSGRPSPRDLAEVGVTWLLTDLSGCDPDRALEVASSPPE